MLYKRLKCFGSEEAPRRRDNLAIRTYQPLMYNRVPVVSSLQQVGSVKQCKRRLPRNQLHVLHSLDADWCATTLRLCDFLPPPASHGVGLLACIDYLPDAALSLSCRTCVLTCKLCGVLARTRGRSKGMPGSFNLITKYASRSSSCWIVTAGVLRS